jgi:hypothetical protein
MPLVRFPKKERNASAITQEITRSGLQSDDRVTIGHPVYPCPGVTVLGIPIRRVLLEWCSVASSVAVQNTTAVIHYSTV